MRNFTRLVLLAATFLCLNAPAFAVTTPVVPPTNEPAPTAVKSAVAEFNGLSKKEKKKRINAVKKAIAKHNAEKKAGMEPSTNTLLLVILALLLPPLAVYLHEGELNSRVWISLILTLLFFIPGVIYALIVILGEPKGASA